MICPKCGNELQPGKLYCEVCGEEIKIVPEFEPEIENSIKEILNDVADVAEEIHDSKSEETEEDESPKIIKKDIKIMMILGACFIFIILAFGIVWFVLDYQYTNYNYQMNKAQKLVTEGELNEASGIYRHVLELKNHDPLATYNLANLNLALGDEESAILLYKEIVANDNGETDIRYNACKSVVDIYVSREDYQSISDFLVAIGDNDITNYFQKYKCKAPDFSYNEGTYDEVIPLKLTASTSGNIYYTVDGSLPTKGSDIYNSPIFLETGDYVVSAFFVNTFGVMSETVTKQYHIDVTTPFAPEVLTYSGDYTCPTLIEVEVPDDCHVYYSTDMTNPTNESPEYFGPLHMPLGKSEFRFVTYNESNVASEITIRNYSLSIRNAVSIEEAQKNVVDGMIATGKIYDADGHSMEINGRYLYLYQYATNVENVGDFYIIAEIYEDTEGIRTRTCALYAVGLYDGKRYRLSLDENNDYVFYEF